MPRPPAPFPTPSPSPEQPPLAVQPARHWTPAAPPRHTLAAGVVLILLPLLIGLLIRMDERPFFQGLDDSWAASMDGSPGDPATGFATVLDRLGGPLGTILPRC